MLSSKAAAPLALCAYQGGRQCVLCLHIFAQDLGVPGLEFRVESNS